MKEAQKAGIEAAHEGKPRVYRGRKSSYRRQQFDLVRYMLGTGPGTSEIARTATLTRQMVIRIRSDMAEAEGALARWGL